MQQQYQEEDDFHQARENELRDAADMLVGAIQGAQISEVAPDNEPTPDGAAESANESATASAGNEETAPEGEKKVENC